MGELKPGWKRVKFGEVAECVNDRVDAPAKSGVDRYVGLDHLDPESLTIRRWGTPDEVESTKLRFRPGDIIFGKRRAYQRKLAVADFEGICSAHAMVLRAKPVRVIPEFLPFFMQSDLFMERAVAISVGSLSPTINWKTLAAEEFALPPLEEQRQAVDLLSSLEKLRVELGNAHDAAVKVRDRLRLEICSRTNRWCKLGDYLSFITSGSRGWSAHYSDAGEVFLRIGNLNSPTIELNLDDIQHVRAPNDGEAERSNVCANDVLLGITGEAGVGLVGFVRRVDSPTFISQHVALIRLDERLADPEFVAHALAGPAGQRQIRRFNQASAKAGMTLGAVRELQVPAYSIDVQRRWRQHVSQAEQTMTELADRLLFLKVQARAAANALGTKGHGQ